MTVDRDRGPLFRPVAPNQRVTYAELFFDLVFAFAVTQISHTLLGRFTPLGALQTTLLLLSVWWTWVYTAWITNWFNPELTPVRVLLFLLMLGGLVLSTSIPAAFESRGLWFALAYAGMQVGRTSFWLLMSGFGFRRAPTRCASWSGYRCRRSSGSRAVFRKETSGSCFGRWRWASNMSRRRCGSGSRNTALRR
jgi:low temperature requirement protein LtrA